MTVVLMPRMQTSRAYEFMGVNPPSFPSIPPHENAAIDGRRSSGPRIEDATNIQRNLINEN